MSKRDFRQRALSDALRHVRRALPLSHTADLDVLIEDCDIAAFRHRLAEVRGTVDGLRWRVDGEEVPAGEPPMLGSDDRTISMVGVVSGLSFELLFYPDPEGKMFNADLVFRGGDLGPSAEDALRRWLEVVWTLAPLLCGREARLESIGEGSGVVVWRMTPA